MKSFTNTDEDMKLTHDDLNEDNYDYDKEPKIGGPKLEWDLSSVISDLDALMYFQNLRQFKRVYKTPEQFDSSLTFYRLIWCADDPISVTELPSAIEFDDWPKKMKDELDLID